MGGLLLVKKSDPASRGLWSGNGIRASEEGLVDTWMVSDA